MQKQGELWVRVPQGLGPGQLLAAGKHEDELGAVPLEAADRLTSPKSAQCEAPPGPDGHGGQV